MTVTAIAQYLRIFDGSNTYHRWQSYYADSTVTWAGAEWTYQPFNADGIIAGDVQSESSLTIGMPATSITLPALRTALQRGHLAEIRQYEFDPQLGNDAPQESQLLLATYTGEVIGLKSRFTWVEVDIGSALAPVGIQVPPRTMSSQLIGVPCQL